MQHAMTPADVVNVRRRWRLSQEALGALVGYTRQTVSLWERGEAPIPLSVAGACWLIAVLGPHALASIWANPFPEVWARDAGNRISPHT